MSTRLKRRIALAKDLILFGIGSGGITLQIVTGQANPWLLLVCTTLVGIQSIAGLTAIARGTPTELQAPSSIVDSSAQESENA